MIFLIIDSVECYLEKYIVIEVYIDHLSNDIPSDIIIFNINLTISSCFYAFISTFFLKVHLVFRFQKLEKKLLLII